MNPLEQTIEQLEGEVWGEPEWQSHVVLTSHALRKKPIREFTNEDLRFMLVQGIGLEWLMPIAIDVLEKNPLAEVEYGSLLQAAMVLRQEAFWREHRDLKERLDVIVDRVNDFVEIWNKQDARLFREMDLS